MVNHIAGEQGLHKILIPLNLLNEPLRLLQRRNRVDDNDSEEGALNDELYASITLSLIAIVLILVIALILIAVICTLRKNKYKDEAKKKRSRIKREIQAMEMKNREFIVENRKLVETLSSRTAQVESLHHFIRENPGMSYPSSKATSTLFSQSSQNGS